MGNIMEYLLFDLPCTIKNVKEVAILSGKTPFQWAQMEGLGGGKWNELNWMLLKECVQVGFHHNRTALEAVREQTPLAFPGEANKYPGSPPRLLRI